MRTFLTSKEDIQAIGWAEAEYVSKRRGVLLLGVLKRYTDVRTGKRTPPPYYN